MESKYDEEGNDYVCDMRMRIRRSNGEGEWLRKGFVKLI
jgi:hypothetical protein